MNCAICGPLDRHDGEHCDTCHAVHRALWVDTEHNGGVLVPLARQVLKNIDRRTTVR